MGRNHAPTVVAGTGMGKSCPHGDGDGESKPDGEFPVAIFSQDWLPYRPREAVKWGLKLQKENQLAKRGHRTEY
jgi:hypothetical protein